MRLTSGKLVLYVILLALVLPIATDALVYSILELAKAVTALFKNIGVLILWVVGIALALRLGFFLKDFFFNLDRLRNQNKVLDQLDGTRRLGHIGQRQHLAFDPVLLREGEQDGSFVFDDVDDWVSPIYPESGDFPVDEIEEEHVPEKEYDAA